MLGALLDIYAFLQACFRRSLCDHPAMDTPISESTLESTLGSTFEGFLDLSPLSGRRNLKQSFAKTGARLLTLPEWYPCRGPDVYPRDTSLACATRAAPTCVQCWS